MNFRIYDRSITLSVGCPSSWKDQIKNSLWLGEHSQTSARPKVPRLLIPEKSESQFKSANVQLPFLRQEKPKRRPCYH